MLKILGDLFYSLGLLLDKAFSWLFSADSSGILTLLTGLIAWLVYRHQLRLREKEAAIILLSEIRHIEETMEIIQSDSFDPYSELINIAPQCSWDKNFQLFVSSLGKNDFDLLNSFFNSAKAIQKLLHRLRDILHESQLEKARITQSIFLRASTDSSGEKEKYEQIKKEIRFFFDSEPDFFKPNGRILGLKKALGRISKVTGTTVFEKIEKVTNRGFFW